MFERKEYSNRGNFKDEIGFYIVGIFVELVLDCFKVVNIVKC